MIGLTVTNNNQDFVITSQAITDFVAGQPTPGFTIKLVSNYNCGDDIEKQLTIADVGGGSYTITPSFYSMSSVLSDGVYYISIVKTPTSGTPSEETICYFLDVNIKCDLEDYLADNLESDVFKYHMALEFVNDCSDCRCIDACVLHDELIRVINTTCNDCN